MDKDHVVLCNLAPNTNLAHAQPRLKDNPLSCTLDILGIILSIEVFEVSNDGTIACELSLTVACTVLLQGHYHTSPNLIGVTERELDEILLVDLRPTNSACKTCRMDNGDNRGDAEIPQCPRLNVACQKHVYRRYENVTPIGSGSA